MTLGEAIEVVCLSCRLPEAIELLNSSGDIPEDIKREIGLIQDPRLLTPDERKSLLVRLRTLMANLWAANKYDSVSV